MYTGIRLLLLIRPFISSFFFLSNFEEYFRHTFLKNCEAKKIETWYASGQWVDVSCIPESGCFVFVPLFLHFSFSNPQTLKCFVTLLSGTVRPIRLKLGNTCTVSRFIVYTGIRLLLLICPFISSFFFLSSFQTLKFFVPLFSGTVWPRRLKLDTHVDNRQMCIPESGCCCLFVTLFLHFSFSPILKHLDFFCHTFLRNCEA